MKTVREYWEVERLDCGIRSSPITNRRDAIETYELWVEIHGKARLWKMISTTEIEQIDETPIRAVEDGKE